MRIPILNIITLLLFIFSLIFGNGLNAQSNHEKIQNLRPLLSKKKYDEIIKSSLIILSSNQDLSLKDSFELYNVFSYTLSQIGDHENALFYAKKSIKLDTKKDDTGYLIQFYNSAKKFNVSINYQKKILQNIKSNHQIKNNNLLSLAFNNLGYTYFQNNQLDSAMFYYKLVVDDSTMQKNNNPYYGLCIGNLGQIYYNNEDYKQALIYMKLDAKLTKYKITGSHFNALIGISECYFMMGKYNKSIHVLDSLFQEKEIESHILLSGFRLMAKVQQKLNDEKNSALYLRKYIQLKDSLLNSAKPSKELVNELSRTRFIIIKKDLSLAREEEKAQKLMIRIYLISFGLTLLLLLTSIIYFRNRRSRNRKIQELKTELLVSDLKYRKKDLSNTLINLTYKRNFINEIQGKLITIQTYPEENIKQNILSLIHEFNAYKNTDKNVELLQTNLNKVNSSFFNKLSVKFPLLTEKEKEFCGLILLNISSKDIANLKNVTPNAIKKTRQRIRKKLPINEYQELASFLNSL